VLLQMGCGAQGGEVVPPAKRAKVGDGAIELAVPVDGKTLPKSISHEDLQTEIRGQLDTHDTRFFAKDHEGEHRSLWHDLPLFECDAANQPTGALNFVCEIPKWTRKKVCCPRSPAPATPARPRTPHTRARPLCDPQRSAHSC